LRNALLPRLPLARTAYASQLPIERPLNVALKVPRALAITDFVRVLFAENVTLTRSFDRKPVPRTVTGERLGTVTWAVRFEAPTATGDSTATRASTAANLTLGLYPA
jgi:hypothetical protein